MSESDEALENVARMIERPWPFSVFTLPKVKGQRRKRREEDAALVRAVTDYTRMKMAEEVRELIGDKKVIAAEQLRHLMSNVRWTTGRELWPLMHDGYIHLDVIVRASENSIPPSLAYRVRLTDRGRKELGLPDDERPYWHRDMLVNELAEPAPRENTDPAL